MHCCSFFCLTGQSGPSACGHVANNNNNNNNNNIYIYTRYEHEAIRLPKTENNIGAPSAPQKGEMQMEIRKAWR